MNLDALRENEQDRGAAAAAASSPVGPGSHASRRSKRTRRRRSRRRRWNSGKLLRGVQFVFPGQITRVSYVLRTLFCLAVMLFHVLIVASASPPPIGIGDPSPIWTVAAALLLAGQLYMVGFVLAPRIRDLGLPRLLALLGLVPILKWFVFAVAAFVPGGALADPRATWNRV